MKRYPCVLQDDASTCGVACLATIARRYGQHPSWHRLREASGNLIDGSNLVGLAEAARAMGFLGRAVRAVPEALPNLPTPFVAHVLREGNGHFVVVHEIRKDGVVVADPAEGQSNRPLDRFLKEWTGKALLLTRDQGLPSKIEAPGLFRRLVGLILPHRWLLAETFAASALMSFLSYGTALVFSNMVDHVFPSGEVWTLRLFSILAIGLAVIMGLFTVINNLLVVTISQRVSVHLMFPTLQRLVRLPMSYFDTRRLGDILHRFSNLLSLKGLVTNGPVTLALDCMTLVMTSAVLFLYHWELAAAILSVLPVMLLVTLLFRFPLRKLYEESLKAGGKLQGQIVSTLGGISTVKSFGAEDLMMERAEPLMGQSIQLSSRLQTLSVIPRVINRVLAGSAVVFIYWLGGEKVMAGEISLGQLIFCVTLAGSVFPPFQSLLGMLLSVQEALATFERATDIVDAEPEPGPRPGASVSLGQPRGAIRIENVSFHYGHEEDCLKDVSFSAAPGESVAIVGQSGSGKSTLLKLLQRFYTPQSGRILVDDADIRDMDLRKLRPLMAHVDQECRTFAGSILDNLQLSGSAVPLDRILWAIRLVGLAPFIEKLPGRYATEVGEAGTRLSGGERQRLALARALASSPKILLLDEATAHVDPKMEREIFLRLKESLPGTTVILATHRLALAHLSDRVIVLQQGRVVEEGRPSDLVAAGGPFAQFTGRQREVR